MNLKRKIFSFFAIFLMLFGLVPANIFAAYAEEPAGDIPKTLKTLKTNNDGTYDITLEVEGVSSQKTEATKANVIVVFDTSGSMSEAESTYAYSASTNGRYGKVNGDYLNLYRKNRWGLCTRIVDNSTTGTVYSDGYCNNLYSGTRYSRTTVSGTRLSVAKSAVNVLANELLSQNDPNTAGFEDVVEMAFVDFATNVNSVKGPTTDLNTFKGWVNNANVSTGNGAGTNWEAALAAAKEISFGTGDNDKTYVIFVSDGNPTFRDSKYNDWANDCRTDLGFVCPPNPWGQGGSDNNGWNLGAAQSVSGTIVSNANMELYAVGTFGEASNMKKLGGTYYDATNQDALETAFADIVNKINMGLSVTDIKIEDGITTSASSEVKGSVGHFRYNVPESWGEDYEKATYDGGSVHWNPGRNKTLSNGEKASVTFTVWPSQEAMDCIAAIRNGEGCSKNLAEFGLEQNTDGSYKLLTNTSATFTYRTRTDTDGVITDSAESARQTIPEERDDTTLPETKLAVTKLWADGMQITQRTDEYGDGITLKLSVDGNEVRTYKFTGTAEGSEWANGYTYTIAPGVMKKLTGPETDGIRASAQKIVRVDGEEYAVLEMGHDYDFVETPDSAHYELTKKHFHPMIVGEGGKIHDVVFYDDGTAKIDTVELTKLSAQNTLNGGVVVSKQVINNGHIDKTIDDDYTIKIALSVDSGLYRILHADGTKSDDIPFSGGVIVTTIKQSDQILVKDLKDGTTFTVSEVLPKGYTKNEISYQLIDYNNGGAITTGSDAQVVHGNMSSTAKVTNYLESGDIVVSKEVTVSSGNLAKAQDKEFQFTMKIYEKQGDTKPVRVESFKLKHGELKTFKNIPVGFYYEIVEDVAAGFNGGDLTIRTGTITKGENKASFKNNYAVTELSGDDAKIVADKNFVSGYENFWLDSDEFTFVMTGNGEKKESIPLTKFNSTAEFEVSIKDEGTYVYTITEKVADENGVSLLRPGVSRLANDQDVVVTIVVEDNGDGTLKLVSKTYSQEKKTIYNLYEASGTLGEGETEGALKFNKVLEGRDWEDFDEFTFTIESEDGKLPKETTKTVRKGQTEFDFGKIKFTTEDAGKTYNYVIKEQFDGNKMKNVKPADEVAGGISFTVEVIDNNDGTLSLKVSSYSHTFTNIYTSDSVTTDESELTKDLFTVKKTVEDKHNRFTGEEFVFKIEGEGFETKTVRINTATEGTKKMDGAFTFEKAGTYRFTAKEVNGTNKELYYDKNVHEIEIEVADNPSAGKLEIKSAKVDGKTVSGSDIELAFVNKYEPEMYNQIGELTVKKIWNDQNSRLDYRGDVTVMLTAKAGERTLWQKPAVITSGNNWTTTFTGLYRYENDVEIEYLVTETGIVGAEEASFIVYGDDILGSQRSVEGKWTNSINGFDITNTWVEATNIYNGESEFWIKKIDENGKTMSGVKFEVAGKKYTTNNDGMIKVAVSATQDVREDNLDYKIKEIETLEGYDLVVGSANVKVTSESSLVDVDEVALKNTYKKEYHFEKSGSDKFVWNADKKTLIVTNNRSLAKSITIQKEIVGVTGEALRNNELKFTLVGPDDFVPLEISFGDFEKKEDGKYEYVLTGRIPTGTYKVVESNAEFDELLTLTISGDNDVAQKVEKDTEARFEIRNQYDKIRDQVFAVRKVWRDSNDKDKLRPEELKVVLLRDGVEYGEAVLNNDNDWTYEWDKLPRAGKDAKPYEYTAVEEDVYGYESDGGVLTNDGEFIFTNTHQVVIYEVVDPCADGGGCGGFGPLVVPNTGTISKVANGNDVARKNETLGYMIGLITLTTLGVAIFTFGRKNNTKKSNK